MKLGGGVLSIQAVHSVQSARPVGKRLFFWISPLLFLTYFVPHGKIQQGGVE